MLLPTASIIGEREDKAQWEIILRSLSAWRSFNWLKTGQLNPSEIADFLIFDKRMPRSILFCSKELKTNLSDLTELYGGSYKSQEIANDFNNELRQNAEIDINRIDLKDLISNLIYKNNSISEQLTQDFNLN